MEITSKIPPCPPIKTATYQSRTYTTSRGSFESHLYTYSLISQKSAVFRTGKKFCTRPHSSSTQPRSFSSDRATTSLEKKFERLSARGCRSTRACCAHMALVWPCRGNGNDCDAHARVGWSVWSRRVRGCEARQAALVGDMVRGSRHPVQYPPVIMGR